MERYLRKFNDSPRNSKYTIDDKQFRYYAKEN